MTDFAVHPALEPVTLIGAKLANRLAVAPMTRVSAREDGTPTGAMARYYSAFASGGFGLVITEGTYTDTQYSQGYFFQPGIVTESHVKAWRPIVESIHAGGAYAVMQLMHAGALSQGNRFRTDTAGPSAVPPKGQMMPEYGGSGPWPTPRAMNDDDIETAIQGFVAAALNARRAGFDGVEVHAANGYLLDQFLTNYTNLRCDAYGGSVPNRIRLTSQVVQRIRAEIPDEGFWIGVRLSQTKVNDFQYRWAGSDDARVVFTSLADAGADYLHVASEGRDWIETARLDDGDTITALAKKVTGLPVIANGGMHDMTQAARLLEEGHADVLSLGRGALANPDLPNRVACGQELEIFDHAMLQPRASLDNAGTWRRDTSA
ncbi:NADH:flavin oxidoreductase [Streptomyces sp. ME01-18a]|uniref:NADH:flavin oxidoreductase n=1 Tax=Streptomyces sp. ME01-18a TaxID=3028669 RepID=UPI0029BB7964|nr:NADH:flavin oxidoreductase [Streptomyces sp. ME01-18a]MDX3434315.1 NADH:flavin oxidoreductase [Streptomyces sp. ME01-18a]